LKLREWITLNKIQIFDFLFFSSLCIVRDLKFLKKKKTKTKSLKYFLNLLNFILFFDNIFLSYLFFSFLSLSPSLLNKYSLICTWKSYSLEFEEKKIWMSFFFVSYILNILLYNLLVDIFLYKGFGSESNNKKKVHKTLY
jgi:hypothetical protein